MKHPPSGNIVLDIVSNTLKDEIKEKVKLPMAKTAEDKVMNNRSNLLPDLGEDSSDCQQASIGELFHFNQLMESNLKSTTNLDVFITNVERQYKRVSLYAVAVWALLTASFYILAIRSNSLERLTGIESNAPMAAFVLIGFSSILTMKSLSYRKNGQRAFSGIIYLALVVQGIAFITDLMLATLPVPVMVDPVTGSRVFLLRWCEWTPLAFLMSFIIETCQLDEDTLSNVKRRKNKTSEQPLLSGEKREPDEKKYILTNMPYYVGWSQGLSTFCGCLFPLCPGPGSWIILLIISCLLFSHIYFRLNVRYRSFQNMTTGTSIVEQEMYNWSRISLGLMGTCVTLWSSLVLAFFMYTIGPLMLPENKFLTIPGLNMICESFIDVLYKSLYMLMIVDVHDAIFDRAARTERRLEELRKMMGVVWDNSSDVIGISIRNAGGDVTTLLSPRFLKEFGQKNGKNTMYANGDEAQGAPGLAFELDSKFFTKNAKELPETITPSAVYGFRFGRDTSSTREQISKTSQEMKEQITSMGELVMRAWLANENETLLMHDFIYKEQFSRRSVRCEANITRMESNALVFVVRDISERFRRFEAEKKVVSETTARKKDAAANRFTRHEVKNGLLAAIGLCDSLRETLAQSEYCNEGNIIKNSTNIGVSGEADTNRFLYELDRTLHEILDTVLAEAMARDVIHEVYEPKLERVNMLDVLNCTVNRTASEASIKRFPLTANIATLPDFSLDPLLLKFIYRNAVSNACKYGQRGGVVATELIWNEKKGQVEMNVINLPGEKHEEILKLGNMAAQLIFSPNKRLEVHSSVPGKITSHSSGDGAWIMHKCAKTLGGECDLKFEPNRTVFTFRCPVTPYSIMAEYIEPPPEFKLPKNIYGIAIDDSKIQRKLLSRYFAYAGIPEDRVRILGDKPSEIIGFGDWVANFVDEHPDDYFLLIVDENLDVDEDDVQMTVSGSQSVSTIRQRLLLDQERRILALIRSANDSANDVAIYNSRAHGYLPKSPIKPKGVKEELAPLWKARFPHRQTELKKENSMTSLTEINECDVDDLMLSTISSIDRLVEVRGKINEQWPFLRERLHVLKGDLQTIESNESVLEAVEMIRTVRSKSVPPMDFPETWGKIRSLVA